MISSLVMAFPFRIGAQAVIHVYPIIHDKGGFTMKKFLALTLVCLFLAPAAVADVPDISGLTFDELITLREQINLAIWQSEVWQEVTVPAGVWEIGKDIPAGTWSVRVPSESMSAFVYLFERPDITGNEPDYAYYCTLETLMAEEYADYASGLPSSVTYIMPSGWFFKCSAEVIFTPYTGKPDLGFK